MRYYSSRCLEFARVFNGYNSPPGFLGMPSSAKITHSQKGILPSKFFGLMPLSAK